MTGGGCEQLCAQSVFKGAVEPSLHCDETTALCCSALLSIGSVTARFSRLCILTGLHLNYGSLAITWIHKFTNSIYLFKSDITGANCSF